MLMVVRRVIVRRLIGFPTKNVLGQMVEVCQHVLQRALRLHVLDGQAWEAVLQEVSVVNRDRSTFDLQRLVRVIEHRSEAKIDLCT